MILKYLVKFRVQPSSNSFRQIWIHCCSGLRIGRCCLMLRSVRLCTSVIAIKTWTILWIPYREGMLYEERDLGEMKFELHIN